jgi:tetratricopeptide (TPR) repeat protein
MANLDGAILKYYSKSMLRCWILLLTTVASCFGIPKSSTKRELQRLVRLPKLEFSKPLEFDRRFGFVAFADANAAAPEAVQLLKNAKGLPDQAPLYLEAARIYDRQGDSALALAHYSRAIDLFRRRIEIAPREAISLAGLGEALAAIGRFGEAESALAKTDELGVLTVEVLLARTRLYRERAWFSAAGEAQRYASGPFLSQLISVAVSAPAPNRIEEAGNYLRLANRSLEQAFEMGTDKDKGQRLLERAAFRSFERGLNLAFTQIQNEDIRPRALDVSLYNAEALKDLADAASQSQEPGIIAASALAANNAAERIEGSGRSGDNHVRRMANRLHAIVEGKGENSASAAEFLGGIQFHLLKDIAGARRTLRQAIALEPTRHRAWEMLVLASAYEGPDQFVEAAEARVAVLPHPRSSVLLIKSYDMEGDKTRAEWTALNAVMSYPNDLLSNLALAAVFLKDENVETYLWRVDEALNKAEKALGVGRNHQNRVDFILLKGIYLGLSDRGDQAKALIRSIKPSSPELQEVLRALD